MVKQKDEKIRGIGKISTFVTADALLAAVLMVWAQIWIQPSVRLWAAWYGKEQLDKIPDKVPVPSILQTFDLNVGLGLILTYSVVFLALLALALASWCTLKSPNDNDRVHVMAIRLFFAALTMALANVAQSICSVTWKVFQPDYLIWEPISSPFVLWCFIGISVVVATIVAVCAGHVYNKKSKN